MTILPPRNLNITLGDLGGDLANESFALSRLLGAETVESPTNTWDSLSLANSNTPPATSQETIMTGASAKLLEPESNYIF